MKLIYKAAWALAGVSITALFLASLLLGSSGTFAHSFSRSFRAPLLQDGGFAADNAIRISGFASFLPGTAGGGGSIGTAGQVPVGSRMVVEFFSASCQEDFAPGVDVMKIQLQTNNVPANTFDTYDFVPTKAPVAPSTSTATSSVAWYIVAQPLHLYSDGTALSPLNFNVFLTTGIPNANARSRVLCSFEVSGYLVTLPN